MIFFYKRSKSKKNSGGGDGVEGGWGRLELVNFLF